MSFKTEQENFWAGKFGSDYIERNKGKHLFASNLAFFSKALAATQNISDCIEFGANIGMNLNALKLLYPELDQHAIEINPEAVNQLKEFLPEENVNHASILDFSSDRTWDLVLIKGVLIHINPEFLPNVYDSLYHATSRYLLVCEYYNPTPVTINYRGHAERLFKRDFCGDLLEKYGDLELIDYGFTYHRDPKHPQDDISWFLMEKIHKN